MAKASNIRRTYRAAVDMTIGGHHVAAGDSVKMSPPLAAGLVARGALAEQSPPPKPPAKPAKPPADKQVKPPANK